MRFYTHEHRFYCGIDLHARVMYLCILDNRGDILLHRNMRACPEDFLEAIRPYRADLVVCCECMFSWYWLADLCRDESITFVLGHALYMKAIHGGKAKNDRIDSKKIAKLLRSGMIPTAYVYPKEMRAARDLLRRRNHLMRKRAELLSHIQNTNSQYNHKVFEGSLCHRANRAGIEERFEDEAARESIRADIELIDFYDKIINRLELVALRTAKEHDPNAVFLLRTVKGIGKVLSLVILYEIHDIDRFPRVQDFVSYARLVACPRESAGKRKGTSGRKIGNMHLKWAFSEAATLFLRNNPRGMKYKQRLVSKHGKAKALSIIAHRLGRAVYFILKRREAFDINRFLAG